MSKSMVSFGTREHAFHEYLQEDLKNEEGFYLDAIVPFGFKVTNMIDLRRREEDLSFSEPDKTTKRMLEGKG
jgi:hypothetical protein